MNLFRIITHIIPDKTYIKLVYFKHFKRFPNLKNPVTYNEKLQWLKLYDRKQLYSIMVDKYLVKEYVSNIIGEQYVIPLLGSWNSFSDIDFTSLPSSFVLKWNHDSGSIYICKNKDSFNYQQAKKALNKGKHSSGFWYGREWPYKNVKRKIIAEEYLEDNDTKELRDFKFFCFDGNPEFMFIATNRFNETAETTFDFYDMDFNHLEIINGHPNSESPINKPRNFDLMIDLAKKLSHDIPHVRIDFYEVDNKVYFGEFTMFHYSGFMPFQPKEWDKIFGDYLVLPN